MKKESGITLITLVLYVILMTIIVGGVANITSSFYSNLNDFDTESEGVIAISKVNMYILKDVKRDGAKLLASTDNTIEMSYGGTTYNPNLVTVVYSIENKALYRNEKQGGKNINKIKICDGIDSYEIAINKTGKHHKATITLTIGEYTKTTTFVLENYSHGRNDVA